VPRAKVGHQSGMPHQVPIDREARLTSGPLYRRSGRNRASSRKEAYLHAQMNGSLSQANALGDISKCSD
jgi:hypothetical protein